MDTAASVRTDLPRCPICGSSMQFAHWETSIGEHRFNGVLNGLEFPMIEHGSGWKCTNPKCQHFEPLPREQNRSA